MNEATGAGTVTGGRENSPFSGKELRERLPEPGSEYPSTAAAVRSRLPEAPLEEEGGRHE